MDPRPDVQNLLESLFDRIPHVYFNPPESVRMVYPCVRYRLDDIDARYANNGRYIRSREYQLIVIDPDPDSELREKVANLKWCRFVRHYTSDNLNHFVFSFHYPEKSKK